MEKLSRGGPGKAKGAGRKEPSKHPAPFIRPATRALGRGSGLPMGKTLPPHADSCTSFGAPHATSHRAAFAAFPLASQRIIGSSLRAATQFAR